MRPTAKSFLLDLLSTLRRGTIPVRALVEAAGLFGIAENSTRVALTRLLASGQIERDSRGRYRLGTASRVIAQRVTSWRASEDRIREWDGRWLGVLDGRRGSAGAQRRRARAHRFLGFARLTPTLAVRPDNLLGGIEDARSELTALGLPAGDLVFALGDLDSLTDSRARRLWDAEALRAGYRALRAEIDASLRSLPALAPELAMVESFLLGGRVIRQLVLDPLLPDVIVPGDERRELLDLMSAYDAQGRSAWATFLARFEVPHRSTPADTRMGAGAERLARQP